jgi:hypothetical protein
MPRQQLQHVVEEADAGVPRALAGAVQVQLQVDLRFARLAVDDCCSRHRTQVSSFEFSGLALDRTRFPLIGRFVRENLVVTLQNGLQGFPSANPLEDRVYQILQLCPIAAEGSALGRQTALTAVGINLQGMNSNGSSARRARIRPPVRQSFNLGYDPAHISAHGILLQIRTAFVISFLSTSPAAPQSPPPSPH